MWYALVGDDYLLVVSLLKLWVCGLFAEYLIRFYLQLRLHLWSLYLKTCTIYIFIHVSVNKSYLNSLCLAMFTLFEYEIKSEHNFTKFRVAARHPLLHHVVIFSTFFWMSDQQNRNKLLCSGDFQLLQARNQSDVCCSEAVNPLIQSGDN